MEGEYRYDFSQKDSGSLRLEERGGCNLYGSSVAQVCAGPITIGSAQCSQDTRLTMDGASPTNFFHESCPGSQISILLRGKLQPPAPHLALLIYSSVE